MSDPTEPPRRPGRHRARRRRAENVFLTLLVLGIILLLAAIAGLVTAGILGALTR